MRFYVHETCFSCFSSVPGGMDEFYSKYPSGSWVGSRSKAGEPPTQGGESGLWKDEGEPRRAELKEKKEAHLRSVHLPDAENYPPSLLYMIYGVSQAFIFPERNSGDGCTETGAFCRESLRLIS